MQKLRDKLEALDNQLAVYATARKKYVAELAEKEDSLQQMLGLVAGIEQAEKELKLVRAEVQKIQKAHPVWMPGDPESAKLENNPLYKEKREQMFALMEKTAEGIDKNVNRIFYRK